MKKNIINIIIIFSSFFFSINAEENKENKKEESEQKTQKNLFDGNFLINEINTAKQIKNLLKSKKEIDEITSIAKDNLYFFEKTVHIKSNYKISGERILWFSLKNTSTEIKLNFKKEHSEIFSLIEKHDYISVAGKFKKVSNYIEFDFVKILKVKTFNPKKAIETNFHAEFEALKNIKSKIRYTLFRNHLKAYSTKNKNKLGYLSGIVKGISLEGNDYVMEMEVNEFMVKIKCHPRYTEILAGIDMNTKITMVALLEEVAVNNTATFHRGSYINWVNPKE